MTERPELANMAMQEMTKGDAVDQEEIVDYRNPRLSTKERVADLIRRMTLEEKVAQMICIWQQKQRVLVSEDGTLNLHALRREFKNGVGQIARLSDTHGGLSARKTAELANMIQKFFREETRLGIPVIFHEECLHGLVAKEATSYPQPIALASTFDPELVEEVYSAIAERTRERGAHQALTPVVDVGRDPRWGRIEETFGEDPYLVAQMGIAAVKGFQGNGNFKEGKRVIATLKHFAAHGEPESGTNCAPVNVSERLLRDTFLFPFKEALQKGGARSVMASYNEIDGVPSHANRWLLRKVLREEWGFNGFVVSDYFGISELNTRAETTSHAVAKDKSEAAYLAAKAGVNLELPDPDCYPRILELVRNGLLHESEVDELIAPMLEAKFDLGLFENPFVDPDAIEVNQTLENERALALRAAHKAITLLQNRDHLLPLQTETAGTLAVIGPNADRKLLGGYSGEPKYFTSVLEGIRAKVGRTRRVVYSEGCKLTVGGSWGEDVVTLPDAAENGKLIREAVEIAREASTVILVLGGNEQTSREAWSRRHLGDRANIDLFGQQDELVKAVLETGKPIIVVLINGRPNSIRLIQQHVRSILECWYLGQELGVAVADVLFGDVNPGGKLPISIPRSSGHIPCYYNHKPSARRGYVDDDVTPLFPFGYGLSYTTFEFSNLRLEKPIIEVGESTTVLVDVTNSGSRRGEEVVQLYIHDVVSSVTRPVKELKGFKRIELEPGESKTVAFPLTPEHLSFTNIEMLNVTEPGEFEIMVGNSSRNEDLLKTILYVRSSKDDGMQLTRK